MSLKMHRTSSLASSGLQRSSTGAVKPSRTFRTSSVGASSSSTYGSSTMSKQAHSSSFRVLPDGPGPLPNKPCIPDKSGPVKYVTVPTSKVTSSRVTDGVDLTTARRKTSNDSGYASSTTNSLYTSGNLRRGKSKSLSQLNSYRNETNDYLSRTPSNRPKMESSVPGVSSRTGHSYTQNRVGTKPTLNGSSNAKSSYSTSIYRSTTHLDYKDPREDRNSLHNGGQSYSSHRDLSNAYTTSGKDHYSVRDVDKTRKATITALPGSDMKCARNSSFSSSNSSPSNSVSNCARKLIVWLISSTIPVAAL